MSNAQHSADEDDDDDEREIYIYREYIPLKSEGVFIFYFTESHRALFKIAFIDACIGYKGRYHLVTLCLRLALVRNGNQ